MNLWMERTVRAVGSSGATAAILVGIPWASIRYVGWPLPTSMPTREDLWDWFDDPFAPARFWPAVSIVGWLIWALLVYLIVREILTRYGHVRPPRLRLPLPGLAAGVVGATATALAAPHAAHAAAMPATPTPEAVPRVGGIAAGAVPVYTAEHGDWLGAIADRFLGDRDAHHRIQALNPQLAGRGPSHIEPGWQLRLPADAVDRGIRRHAAGHLAPPTAPSSAPPAEPGSVVPHEQTAPATASDTPAADDGDDGDGHPDVVVSPLSTGAMTGAGLLASLLFALLTAERRRQRGLFAAGQQPPAPANGRAERDLRAAQQPADVERLDLAIRTLSESLARRATRPDIVGVRLVGGDVQVLLAEPAGAPSPWLDEDSHWVLPAYVQPATTTHEATILPTLVTVGSRAGRHLLINLQRLGTLSITGHPDRVRELLRHIACELACNTWTGTATILLAGFGPDADPIREIAPDRVAAIESATAIAALHDLVHRQPTGSPTVLLVADPDTATRAAIADLHRSLVAPDRSGIAVVAMAVDTERVGHTVLTVSDAGVLTVDVPGLRQTTDAAAVPVDMLEPMAQVFRVARLTPAVAVSSVDVAPSWQDMPDPAETVLALFDNTPPAPTKALPTVDGDPLDADVNAWYATHTTVPRIAILGPIDVRMPTPLHDSRHRLYTEMLLYMLTRPRLRTDRAAIEDALWYGNPAGDGTIRKVISKLRRWLGPRVDGSSWIPEGDNDGGYRLEPGLLLDWHLLLRLRDRGIERGADGIADHRAALALIRGVPMGRMRDSGPYRRPYTWIGDSDIAPGRIIAIIADIAHRVADYHLENGDPGAARWAIDEAWLADPERSFDDLWYDRMRAEHQDGQHAALQQLVSDYLDAREAEVLEDLPTPTYNRIRALIPTA